MAVQNQDKTFENFESNFFSFESVLSSDKTDPDKNFLNSKLQQIDSIVNPEISLLLASTDHQKEI